MRSFGLELKSICRNFRFLALIMVLLAYQVMLFSQFQTESLAAEAQETVSNTFYRQRKTSWVEYWEKRYDYLTEHGHSPPGWYYHPQTIIHDLNWYRYEKKIAEAIVTSFQEKDWPTYTRAKAEKNLLEWNMYLLMGFDTGPEEFLGADWEGFKKLIEPLEVTTLPYWTGERLWNNPNAEIAALRTAYFLHLAREDLHPASSHDTTPWGFAFNFMRRGLPNILGLIVLLMTVNLVHRDKHFGVIKSVLQRPKHRINYLLRKVSLGFVASLLVVLIPLLLMFGVLGINQGYSGARLPVLLDKNFLNLLVPYEHSFYTLNGNSTYFPFGLSQYQLAWHRDVATLPRLEILPLWQFLYLAAVLLVLFVLFCTVLGLLISVLIKKDVPAQIVAVAIFALGLGFGRIVPGLRTTPWDIFSHANVIPILEGAHYSTYLGSIVTLIIAILVLFGLAALVFRKQDITTE